MLFSMISVLIVDDHPVMRELLCEVLETHAGLSVIAEAQNGEDALGHVIRLQPDIALIDINLPTMSGVELTKLIKLRSPMTAIIGLTAGGPNTTDVSILAAGANAVIDKADAVYGLHGSILQALKNVKAPA
jgi:DNA-binding NarL/FixJ family response regulator